MKIDYDKLASKACRIVVRKPKTDKELKEVLQYCHDMLQRCQNNKSVKNGEIWVKDFLLDLVDCMEVNDA